MYCTYIIWMQTHAYKPITNRFKLCNFIHNLPKKKSKQNNKKTLLFPSHIAIWYSQNRRTIQLQTVYKYLHAYQTLFHLFPLLSTVKPIICSWTMTAPYPYTTKTATKRASDMNNRLPLPIATILQVLHSKQYTPMLNDMPKRINNQII